MVREVLTKQQIQKDLLRQFRFGNAAVFLLVTWGVPIIALAVIGLFNGFLKSNAALWAAALGVMCISVLVSLLITISISVKLMKIRKHITAMDFRIVLDKLVYTEDQSDRFVDGMGHRNYYLNFASFGRYMLTQIEHYSWSSRYRMSAAVIYNTAMEGDEFYIITIDCKEPLMIYSTKLFKYQE